MKIIKYILLILMSPILIPTSLGTYILIEKDPTWKGYLEFLDLEGSL